MLGGLDYRTIAVAVKRALTALGGVLVNPVGADGYALRGSSAATGGIAWAGAGLALWNGTLSATQNGTVLTVAVKTTAGNDPSDADPVFAYFRDPTSKNGTANLIKINAPTSISTVVGGTFGVANSQPFRLWIVGFNDGGTFRLGLINCVSTTNHVTGVARLVTAIYQLAQVGIASSTQIGAGSTATATFYTAGAAVASKAYTVLGNIVYDSGLATAGTFNVDQSSLDLFRAGSPLPGAEISRVRADVTGVGSTAAAIPNDDTIPQNTEGAQMFADSITPRSAANIIDAEVRVWGSGTVASRPSLAHFLGAAADALGAAYASMIPGADQTWIGVLRNVFMAGTTSSLSLSVRLGIDGGTVAFNGLASTATRRYGGVGNTYHEIIERMG